MTGVVPKWVSESGSTSSGGKYDRTELGILQGAKTCSSITLHHARESTCESRFREGMALVWGHSANQHASQVSTDSRLCCFLEGQRHKKLHRMACGSEDRDGTVGAGVAKKFPWGPEKEPSSLPATGTTPRFPCQLPGSSAVPAEEEAASALGCSFQDKILPVLGSDTTDVPLKIKPGLLPAPSGRLLISRSYDLGYLLPRNFPEPSAQICLHLGRGEDGDGWD